MITDTLNRPLKDLRISVTDRCNFRCGYCMPKEKKYQFLAQKQILTFDEISRLAQLFAQLGTSKIRITGGEPLLRMNLPDLVNQISLIEGIKDIAMTTNGYLLHKSIRALYHAGLNRVTISLDAIDPNLYKSMSGTGMSIKPVLDGIDEARSIGMPVKVNVVIQKNTNTEQIIKLCRHFRHTGVIIRFIEYMDVGTKNGWVLTKVYPGQQILADIQQIFPIEPIEKGDQDQVAKRYRYCDGAGEIGVITSISKPFCHTCSRARLSANGILYTCLFANEGTNLLKLVRAGQSDQQLTQLLQILWKNRDDQYSFNRTKNQSNTSKIEMNHIGG